MATDYINKICTELSLKPEQVAATIKLLDDAATVPFISRYRKEATGSLDEVAVTAIRDRLQQLQELDKRRAAIVKSLEERELLTDELNEKIMQAEAMAVLEDIYLPFRPKRRTRAMIAREKGLEPLATLIFDQGDIDPAAEAESYIDEEKGVAGADEALQGARDIIAEQVNEDQDARADMRLLYSQKGTMVSKIIEGKEEEGEKYKDYFDWNEPISKAPSHRVLAIRRGEKELCLSMRICPDEDEAVALLKRRFVKTDNAAAGQVGLAITDCYKRLLSLSMETEIRLESKRKADDEAVSVFAENAGQLLMAAPLGQKRVMGIDPGFRTGCKVVCLDRQGKLLHNDTIYPHPPQKKQAETERTLNDLCNKFEIEVIAVGNGTAGRETESFVSGLKLSGVQAVVMVNESGASIYSASAAAREEFPDHDITVRGSVSIGRRLMDPLAELVKIDPKSIGVGQYQHDVDQKMLKEKLDDVVMSSVNKVGVEVNTASKQLLTYVSGLGPRIAANIVKHRDEHGPFAARKQLLKVSGLGPKAFEQAAGFLRIHDAADPLDASAVHPESYDVVENMAAEAGCAVAELMRDETKRKQIDLKKYITDTVGLPTLTDIMAELVKPGRDPRERFEIFSFSDEVNKIGDLEPGMKLPGIVTNITNFGAFVDIGVHQDGLVHISQLADKFVKNTADEVKLQQRVMVTVVDIDAKRKRIALSMRSKPELKEKK
ncbi:MAG: RNA-binding transcriptional accessory protein [Deltaproteobacteria bacterium]|nr:RNA-binding transcriptional accessory protein [Deltaproteobacteria bacterium]